MAHTTQQRCYRGTTAESKRFPCPISGCSKSFRRRFGLKEHVVTHTGEKPFVCPVDSCGRSFATSGNLSRHKRVQHPWLDVPLQCLVDDCTCVFPTEKKLEHHMAMAHFSTTAHACGVVGCGRAFSTAGNLRRHMRQNHSDELVAKEARAKRVCSPVNGVYQVRSPTAVDESVGTSYEPLAFGCGRSDDADLWDMLSYLFE